MAIELPPARVVREGGRRVAASGATPDHVLELAPRKLPRRLVWRLWFGSSLATFAWVFAAFGMLGTFAFVPMTDLRTPAYDRTTSATITSIEETSSSENDDPIYRVHYSFVDERGVTRRGTSYGMNRELGAQHQVHYVADDPDESRLDGMRSSPFGWFVLFVLIFPTVGLALALPQLRTGRLATRLLRFGVETRGKLIKKEATDTKEYGVPVMLLTFEYQLDGGARHQVAVETTTPAVLEDDALEPMLYDPYAPQRALPLDHLPGSPTIGADGEIQSRPGFAVHLLVMPAVTVAALIATIAALALGWSL